MKIYKKMQEIFGEAAAEQTVRYLDIGLGYTAVELSDGRVGIAYTYITGKDSCALFHDRRDFEGAPASQLLELLESGNLVERSAAVAAVNALNSTRSGAFPADGDSLVDDLGLKEGDVVAMAGYFGPVVAKIEAVGASVHAHDIGKGIGAQQELYELISSGKAKGLVFTSTSIINGSTEEVLSHLHRNTPCALLGPTTPMIPEVFEHLPVQFLGGIAPENPEGIFKAVRNGRGTRDILKAAKKVYFRRAEDEVPPLR